MLHSCSLDTQADTRNNLGFGGWTRQLVLNNQIKSQTNELACFFNLIFVSDMHH